MNKTVVIDGELVLETVLDGETDKVFFVEKPIPIYDGAVI